MTDNTLLTTGNSKGKESYELVTIITIFAYLIRGLYTNYRRCARNGPSQHMETEHNNMGQASNSEYWYVKQI